MKGIECPICGETAFPVYWTGNLVCICCPECGAQSIWYDSVEDAIKAWNESKFKEEK